MPIVEKLDEYGKGAWIALIILGFWTFWPVGLTALMFVVFSGRARALRIHYRGQWPHTKKRGRGGRGGRHGRPGLGRAGEVPLGVVRG